MHFTDLPGFFTHRVFLPSVSLHVLSFFTDDKQSEVTTSFLTQLSTWDKEELNERLQQRVGFSKRAIGKLLKAFDCLLARYNKLVDAVETKAQETPKVESGECLPSYSLAGFSASFRIFPIPVQLFVLHIIVPCVCGH